MATNEEIAQNIIDIFKAHNALNRGYPHKKLKTNLIGFLDGIGQKE